MLIFSYFIKDEPLSSVFRFVLQLKADGGGGGGGGGSPRVVVIPRVL